MNERFSLEPDEQIFGHFLNQKGGDISLNVECKLFWIVVGGLALMYHHQKLVSAGEEQKVRLERILGVND